jgi:FhuF 2Fe-2S C-terminal domain
VPGPVVSTRSVPRRRQESAGSPLHRFGAWLGALYPEYPQAYTVDDLSTGRPAGWVAVPGAIAAMASGDGAHLGVSPAVAGARLAGSLGYAAAGRPAVALAVAGRAYDTGPDSLLVHLDGERLVDRIGVRNPLLVVAADDPLAGSGHPPGDSLAGSGRPPGDVLVLPDRAAVGAWAAARAWASLDRLVDELHELTGYGRIPMWNLVADAVLGPAATAAGLAGLDPRAGFEAADRFLDALVDLGAPIRRRGTLCESGPGATVVTRGSCCLWFRQGEEKCLTCPLVRDRA